MNHPVVPPQELLSKWRKAHLYTVCDLTDLFVEAAQWGADEELERCCDLFESNSVCGTKFQRRVSVRDLREKRRPKPKKVSMTVSFTGTEAELQSLFQKLSHDREISIEFR